jgi:hypothetical protein
MKLYNSYIKKTEKDDIIDLIFIKNGFSFPAFFFNLLWFLYHKMMRGLILVIIIDIFLIKIYGIYKASATDILLAFISTSLIIAANANYWYGKGLKKKGYEFIGCVFGENKEAAKLRFVEGYIEKYDEKIIKKYKFLDEEDREFLKFKKKKKIKTT